MSSLKCDGGDERTRVFAESFLKEGSVSAHANAEKTAQTSATSKIFLNGMFAFTFTVTSVRKRTTSSSGLARVNGDRKEGRTHVSRNG